MIDLRLRFLAPFLLVALGCGGDDADTGATGATGSGGGTSSSSGSTTGGTTGSGGAGSCTERPGATLAMNKLFLGDKGFDDVESPQAWKQFGFDVDAKVSTAMSTDLCTPAAGAAPSSVYPDGDLGIDNSFGKNVLPLFLSFSPSAPDDTNQSITEGGYTFMLRMDGLASGPDSSAFATLLYAGAKLEAPPAFDGSDCWPVTPDLVSDPTNIDSAKVQFPMSTVMGDVFASGAPTTFLLSVPVAASTLNLEIKAARVSMTLDADHEGATVGIIGGVVDTEEFIVEVRKLVTNSSPAFCDDGTWASIANQIRGASDIMNDGTQDSAQTCNGISIGLGFTMKRVILGPIAEPVAPGADPCAMP